MRVIVRLIAAVVFSTLFLGSHSSYGEPRAATDAQGPDTPQGALLGYLEAARRGDYDLAARSLDLRGVPAARHATLGPSLAQQLYVVLDRAVALDPGALSDEPTGRQDDGLPADAERVATIPAEKGAVDVLLARVPGDRGTRVWKVAAATVAQIPALYGQFGYGRLGDLLPPMLVEVRVLDIALWQWIGLLVVIVVAYAASWLAALALMRVLRPLARRSRSTLDEALLDAVAGPIRLGAALLLFAVGALALRLSLAVGEFLVVLEKVTAIAAVAWFLVRAVDLFAGVAIDRLTARGRTVAVVMVPVGSKVAKVVLLGFALLAVLQNVGVNVTGVLAGLGIGGLAVALAAQKTVENLFGGLTLVLDQPVRVGDFCRFGGTVGTVEEIGLRSTRIRTLERTVVSVPNAQFAASELENFAKRDRVWLHPKIGLRYETTPDQLRYVLVEIRKMLYAHPKVDPDPARIRFVGFGAYSLDLEIFAYVLTADYGEFLAAREDIYLRIIDIVAASGTGFAFPSQTMYLGRDSGLDEAKSRAAEAHVRAWRAEGELYLPEFPPEKVASLRSTLSYPENGAR